MSELDLNERELAAGAAIAMSIRREDQKDAKADRTPSLSGTASALTIGFVVLMSVGMLVVMMLNRS